VQALGIDLTRLRVWVFVLGTMLAAFAGVVMAPLWGIRPHMGVDAVVPAFLIIVLGGVGSFWGAAIGGILVGMVVGLSGAYASEWSMLSMYLLLIAVVTFPRPRPVSARRASWRPSVVTHSLVARFVMVGLVPTNHPQLAQVLVESWIVATSPRMTAGPPLEPEH